MSLIKSRVVPATQLSTDGRFSLREFIPILAMHAGLVLLCFTGFSGAAVIALAVTYVLRVFALTGGYHRYFSHRAYKTSRGFQFVLAFLGTTAGQLGPLWWAAQHRHHHQHSDDPLDAHSPRRQGFFHAHMGWLMCPRNALADESRIRDFLRFPELRWLDRWHFLAPLALMAILYGVGEWLHRGLGFGGTSGLQLVAWGFILSTVLVYHVTFSINSLTHMIGKRRFATTDDSRNSLLLALVTMGEGWHNNHHHYPLSARQGLYAREIDLTYGVLLVLQKLGLIWDVREPPAAVYAEARAADSRN